MATTQQYSLRWNNYFRHLTYALDNHRTNDDFVDVSLCCDGRKIKAHKVVLSSCSAYFKEIFKENPHPHPVIIFKFIKFEDLNSIVEFMYQGEVNVQQEALQSFLQTAELLSVQGLTSEEKEKPKAPPTPILDDPKYIKTIPSTIRAISEASTSTPTHTAAQTQTSTQTIDMPGLLHSSYQFQSSSQPQTTHQTHQVQHILHQSQPITAPTHNLPQQQTLTTTTGSNAITTNLSNKKRKITFSDDEDNIYTTETVDYTVKDDQTIVKTSEMTFLRGAVKMDIPDYIVSEVDDSDNLTDGTTQQNSQDATGTADNVNQFTSEYEILTESEIEDKYHADGDNTEITIEMGRLLHTSTSPNTDTHVLDETGGINTISGKTDGKNSSSDLPSNKWTECQFCKMVITTVNLWRHIRTQHTPQPPRKCDLCNKNFKNKYSLREHIRISHEQKIASKSEN